MHENTGNRLLDEAREFFPAFYGLIFFSFVITLLFLVPTIYMHQIFERVMQSRSFSTLIFLSAIVTFLGVVWTMIEHARAQTLRRIANALDDKISVRIFDTLNRHTDGMAAGSRSLVLSDLNTIRDFIGGTLLIQFFDCMWVPLIILAGALFHPMLGLTLFGFTVLVAALAYLTQFAARDDAVRSAGSAQQAGEFGRSIMSSAESVRVMGMLPALVGRWRERQSEALGWQQGAIDRTALAGLAMRFVRHMYMPILLTVGAVLFLNDMVGGGIVLAASILGSRAIGPIDAVANNWRAFWNVSLAAKRLDRVLSEAAKRGRKVALPTPDGPLVVSRVSATPRNRDMAVLNDVSFSVAPGRIVGVVGASGAGKSSLARVLVGAWPVVRGSISLDGSELAHWDQDQLGRHVGYVPQDVELLPGTVAENIARFEEAGPESDARVNDAVRLANVQDIVAKLPEGLNTRLGPDGHTLSGGQRQRIALARAVYGQPRLVVLDEPNSNLDALGEQSLAETIGSLRDSGAIVVLVTHRMTMLAYCDLVLVMNAGTVHAFGERDQVVNRLSGYQPPRTITSQPPAGANVAA